MAKVTQLIQQVQDQTSAVTASLEKIQKTLAHLENRASLSTAILSELKVADGEYFTLERIYENNHRLSAITEEVKSIKAELSEVKEVAQEIDQAFPAWEVEAKAAPDNRQTLYTLQNALYALLMPPNCVIPESKDVVIDQLLDKVTHQPSDEKFLKTYQKLSGDELLDLETSTEMIPGGFFRKETIKKTHKAVLTDKGCRLRDAVLAERSLETTLQLANENLASQLETLKKIEQKLPEHENSLVSEKDQIVHHLRTNIAAASQVEEKLAHVETLIGGVQSHIDNIARVRFECLLLKSNEDASLDDCQNVLAQMTDVIQEEKNVGIECRVREIEALLNHQQVELATHNPIQDKKRLHGKARHWIGLIEKFKSLEAKKAKLLSDHQHFLSELTREKENFSAIVSTMEAMQSPEIRVTVLPVSNPEEYKVNNGNEENEENNPQEFARWKRETEKYLKHLSVSIKNHLSAFKKMSREIVPNPYLSVWLLCDGVVYPDALTFGSKLEQLYTWQQDANPLQNAVSTNLETLGQTSLKHTLHKYRLMTQLMTAKNSQQFLTILQQPESINTLAERRDSYLMIWARACGPRVEKIVLPIIKLIDEGRSKLANRWEFFKPRGVGYVKDLVPDNSEINQLISAAPGRRQ